MFKHHGLQLLLLVTTIFSASGCISTLFKEPAPTFSNELTFESPESSFTKISSVVYPSWKNSKSGNVISILSDCSSNSPSLKSAHSMISNSIDHEVVTKEEKIVLNGQPAFLKKSNGTIDGTELSVFAISFTHKNCVYLSTLSGRPEKIEDDNLIWTAFNQKIRPKK